MAVGFFVASGFVAAAFGLATALVAFGCFLFEVSPSAVTTLVLAVVVRLDFCLSATKFSQFKSLLTADCQYIVYMSSVKTSSPRSWYNMLMIYVLAMMSFIVLALSTRINKKMTEYKRRVLFSQSSLLKDLPSVSVCIPARNEHHAMTSCLERVLASNYPKLEVIVIDDESVDSTPTLVKSFAHEGVRFVAGGEVPDGWLGKNHALDVLLKEASGTYVLFMDVDTNIEPNTIGQMVAYAAETKVSMMSVLPTRTDLFRSSVLLAPLRYFWHILFSGRHNPVAASNAWMINRRAFINEAGDFSSYKTAVEPEIKVARLFAAQKAYGFLVSDELLGVSYEKKLSSQLETSIRLRFPMLHFSVFRSIGAMILLIFFAVAPYIFALAAIVMHDNYVLIFAFMLLLLEMYAYNLYLRSVWKKGNLVGSSLVTLILLEDAMVTFQSMFSYLTNTVTWKGRPISRDIRRGK